MPPFWLNYVGEKRTTMCKAYWIKLWCFWGHFGNDKSSHTKQHCFKKIFLQLIWLSFSLSFSFLTHLALLQRTRKHVKFKFSSLNIFELRTFSMTIFYNHTLPHLQHVPNLSIVKVFVHVKRTQTLIIITMNKSCWHGDVKTWNGFHFVANLLKKSPFCVHIFQDFKKLIQPPKFNSIILIFQLIKLKN